MPTVYTGKKGDPTFELEKSDDLIAVRTLSKESVRAAAPVRPAFASEVNDGSLVLAFPEAGVEVYRVPTRARSLEKRKAALRASPDVRFAGGVLVDPKSKEPVVYTENLFVKFKDTADPDACEETLHQAGLTVKERLDYATNAYFVAAPEGTGTKVFEIAEDLLLKHDDVEYAHPELVRKREAKGIFPQQWHLKATTIGGVAVSAHANVEAAHAVTRGAGATVALIDDGVDIDHAEFNVAGKLVAPRDATLGSTDPRPKDPSPQFPENHGTACAGVACAAGNVGASGVAPLARLIPIRLASGLGSQQEANAFKWAADNGADVISCSWGPADGDWSDPSDPVHQQVVPMLPSTRLALQYATTNGRGGKGCLILFAAGNGNESVENDGYASSDLVTAVAACNDRGKRSVYSDFGKAVWCAFPSSDLAFAPLGSPAPLTPGIWTTDRVGTRGYNRGSTAKGDAAGLFTNSFGGTSSACPGAAGVAALIVSVNPDLKWQEVKDILKRSCDRIDPQGGSYDADGHSAFYGFGRLNARTAVDLAKPQPTNRIHVAQTFNAPIPDLQTVHFSLEVADTSPVDALSVSLDIKHTYIGDLVITLTPPAATGVAAVRLHNRDGGSTRDLRKTYDALSTPALGGLRGKSCKGTWTLDVKDAAAQDSGTLVSFGLDMTLPAAPTPAPASPRVRSSTKAASKKVKIAPDGPAKNGRSGPQRKAARKTATRKAGD